MEFLSGCLTLISQNKDNSGMPLFLCPRIFPTGHSLPPLSTTSSAVGYLRITMRGKAGINKQLPQEHLEAAVYPNI